MRVVEEITLILVENEDDYGHCESCYFENVCCFIEDLPVELNKCNNNLHWEVKKG